MISSGVRVLDTTTKVAFLSPISVFIACMLLEMLMFLCSMKDLQRFSLTNPPLFCSFVQKYKMGRLLSVLFLLNLFIACGEKLPEGVMPKEKLPELLVQIHLMDADVSSQLLDSTRAQLLPKYEELFKYYNIDSTSFKNSIDYYAARPVEMKEIYDVVTTRLQEIMDADNAVRAAQYREQMLADSLKAVFVRDSTYKAALDSVNARRKRHLLFNHLADSTYDKPIPYHFINYSVRLFDEQRLWRINFWPYTEMDSTIMLEPRIPYPNLNYSNELIPASLAPIAPPVNQDSGPTSTIKHRLVN
jgi:hypothetical protein